MENASSSTPRTPLAPAEGEGRVEGNEENLRVSVVRQLVRTLHVSSREAWAKRLTGKKRENRSSLLRVGTVGPAVTPTGAIGTSRPPKSAAMRCSGQGSSHQFHYKYAPFTVRNVAVHR